jgi:hypothetical protein
MSLQISDQGVLSHRHGLCAIMPSIKQLNDRSLIACQTAGTAFTSSDHSIEVLKSSDDGLTWLNLGTILQESDQTPWSYRAPNIDELPDGRLVMNASRFESTPGDLFDADTEGLKRGETVILWSTDRGNSWSSPQVVPVGLPSERYTWNGAGKLVRFSSSRWMYPLETWKPIGYAGPPDQKAAAVFSSDEGRTWGDFTVLADDTTGKLAWWDQLNTQIADGSTYVMLWTHCYGTKKDLPVHWIKSADQGRTWTQPRPTNLLGQVCCPIGLPDGRVAAIYNYRHEPQGIRVTLSADLSAFDTDSEVVVFDAKSEATLGASDHENFLAEHQLIGFGKPQGILLHDGTLLASYWCTVKSITHTRWVRLHI